MTYLYHKVPEEMKGHVLYPLNRLKDLYPDIYSKRIESYNDLNNKIQIKSQEKHALTIEQNIKPLNCLWGDVLQLSAIHPQRFVDAYKKFGKNFSFKAYKIDPYLLDPKYATVFLQKSKNWGDNEDGHIFLKYDPDELEQYTEIPKGTLEYYEFAAKNGKRSLQFHLVPHIFYKGEIDISGLEIIEV